MGPKNLILILKAPISGGWVLLSRQTGARHLGSGSGVPLPVLWVEVPGGSGNGLLKTHNTALETDPQVRGKTNL